MGLFGPYYYGKYKWDNYLLDIQDTITAGNVAQRDGVRLQARAFEIANEQLDELREQTEHLQRIEETLNGGFEALRSEFEWGFTLMADRLDRQIEILSEVAARLDAIHKTLQSPLLTQARELFQLGHQHFLKGLLDKALDAYLKAEQKNEVDFLLQLQIGKLYLYGRDEDDNVIDLPNAEKHLLLAARYAEAEKGTVPQWNEYCGQAYFHAAVTAYLVGEQEQAAGRLDSMRACLERALGYLSKAAKLWPRFTEIVYTQAKCHALLGQVPDATEKFTALSDRDRRYLVKASQDSDFSAFSADILDVFKRAVDSPGPLARSTQAKLEQVVQFIAWARHAGLSAQDSATVDSFERGVSTARQSLRTLDVDIEGLSERLSTIQAELDGIIERSFTNNIAASEQAVTSAEARRQSNESSIQQLEKTMKETSGAAMGCLFLLLFPAVSVFFFNLAVHLIEPQQKIGAQPQSTDGQALLTFGILATMASFVVGPLLGSKLSRDRQNRPHRLKIEEHRRAPDESVAALPLLNQRADAWKQERRNFAGGWPAP